ncbi:2-C-methyl-D-erythritol 4-phosphate cytidylyltransferase [Paludibacter sp. 221]|uniref:2-C-methyl-D-erythritol 4-phosphate cytidylyltransferase n=1 Tax=Paludibacter sp. 221 TaxID=2302939 RepID=UPI0013D7753C|nr:2-C-methyl-D-erythritol 4-phosphate cytidylyltransferase [Paludibacter sp. 221]NDV47530.1 2-C-methyl-D-erythritol 4-phosphate cytidylyltransferase [Paludibacter sp. 221]
MKKTVIIVAGGKGERMNASIPKQFIELKGKPVLMHTIEAFYSYDNAISIIVVLPLLQIEYWEDLCKKHSFGIKHLVAKGGATRFHSVKNGLSMADASSLVAVHDGVRPLVSHETISRCFTEAERCGAVIPVVDMVDSIRRVEGESNFACDRSQFKLVQTPQVFDGKLLKNAYEQEFSDSFTDDASVVESAGAKIHLVQGNRENIKITTAFDLTIAGAFLS